MMTINGLSKDWARLIQCFGLTETQVKEVEKNVPTGNCEVMKVDCFTDIIAMPQMVAIVVWDEMSEIDKGSFEEFYTEISPFPETLVVIGNADLNPELKRQVLEYDSYESLAQNLKYVLLGAYKKTKKNENFSSNIANALFILKEIKKKPYITTKQLADALELSPRTVQRYIETLRVAGEWIEYDMSHKGWRLGYCESILADDVWDN